MMNDETFWEVHIKYPKRTEWLVISKYSRYELAKKRYDEFIKRNNNYGVRIARVEIHSVVILEDLKGDKYAC